MGIKNKETFKYHYNLEVSNGRCSCGPGSEPEQVKQAGTIEFINSIIKKYGIKSISDCPCGLFENWMHLVDLTNVVYTGYDINDLAIKRNLDTYPNISFVELDMVNELLPKTDLIICRDCLFHLPNSFVSSALKNFYASGSKYLLATEHNWLKVNRELTKQELAVEAGYKHINLEIEPFNLGAPLEVHDEDVWRYYDAGHNKQMSLWKLN
jgi:hypothetical protein